MEVITKSQRFVALHYRDFRLLWIGLLISNIGSQMQLVAINWHIYLLTNSAVALGLIGFTRFIPIVFFSLISGSFADTHNRKKIMFYSQIVFLTLSLILTIATMVGSINPILMYIVSIGSSIAFSFDLPARQALVPNLVERKHLSNAISLNTIMFQTSLIVGPSIAGFVIAKFGLETVYFFNTVSYLAVITALLFMKTSGEVTGQKSSISFSSVKEGLSYVKSKTIIWSTMLLDFFSTFFSSAAALLPIFAKDVLKVGPEGLGFLYAAPAIGAVIAGFIITHVGEVKKQGVVLLSAVSLYGVATIIFGLSNLFILSLLALLLVGLGDGISMIIRNTIRQLSTPDYIRGRMTAINMIFFMGGPQLGEFEAGLLAAFMGAKLSVVTGGIGTLIAVGIMAATIPTLRKYTSFKDH